MTDEDIYAQAIGKRFKHIRGELCRPLANPADSARSVADYIKRELERLVEGLSEQCGAVVRELERGETFFGRDELLANLDRKACDNLGTQHIAESLRRTIEQGAGAPEFFRNLADLGVNCTRARLAVDSAFKFDVEFISAFDTITSTTIETYARLLAKPHRVQLPPPHERAKTESADLLDFVVARRK